MLHGTTDVATGVPSSDALGACRTWSVESENRPQRGAIRDSIKIFHCTIFHQSVASTAWHHVVGTHAGLPTKLSTDFVGDQGFACGARQGNCLAWAPRLTAVAAQHELDPPVQCLAALPPSPLPRSPLPSEVHKHPTMPLACLRSTARGASVSSVLPRSHGVRIDP